MAFVPEDVKKNLPQLQRGSGDLLTCRGFTIGPVKDFKNHKYILERRLKTLVKRNSRLAQWLKIEIEFLHKAEFLGHESKMWGGYYMRGTSSKGFLIDAEEGSYVFEESVE